MADDDDNQRGLGVVSCFVGGACRTGAKVVGYAILRPVAVLLVAWCLLRPWYDHPLGLIGEVQIRLMIFVVGGYQLILLWVALLLSCGARYVSGTGARRFLAHTVQTCGGFLVIWPVVDGILRSSYTWRLVGRLVWRFLGRELPLGLFVIWLGHRLMLEEDDIIVVVVRWKRIAKIVGCAMLQGAGIELLSLLLFLADWLTEDGLDLIRKMTVPFDYDNENFRFGAVIGMDLFLYYSVNLRYYCAPCRFFLARLAQVYGGYLVLEAMIMVLGILVSGFWFEILLGLTVLAQGLLVIWLGHRLGGYDDDAGDRGNHDNFSYRPLIAESSVPDNTGDIEMNE